ncbi:ARL14 protein, partial [Drymodes brunneopygia]|nr:ARL14 protein [Drymodes brunneopygia]
MGLQNAKASPAKRSNVVMLGLDWAGKSTLLCRLRHRDAFLTVPTVGFNVDMIPVGKDFTLTFWDVGGQKKMREQWGSFLEEETDALLFVVDSHDKRRLEEARRELELVLKNESIRNVPVVVLANKQDLPGALNAEEVTRRLKMKKHCSDRNWYVQPCCATTGQGLPEALHRVATFARQYRKSKETFTTLREF